MKIGQHNLPDAPNSCLGESQGDWVRGISALLEAFLEQGGFYVRVISTTWYYGLHVESKYLLNGCLNNY